MKWTVIDPHYSALCGVTRDTTLYTVYFLDLPASDNVMDGFVEYWRRILSDGPRHWNSDWEMLVFEFYAVDGLFTATFETRDRMTQQPGVFKIMAHELTENFALEEWKLLCDAATREPIPTLLAAVQSSHPMTIWGWNYLDGEPLFALDI